MPAAGGLCLSPPAQRNGKLSAGAGGRALLFPAGAAKQEIICRRRAGSAFPHRRSETGNHLPAAGGLCLSPSAQRNGKLSAGGGRALLFPAGAAKRGNHLPAAGGRALLFPAGAAKRKIVRRRRAGGLCFSPPAQRNGKSSAGGGRAGSAFPRRRSETENRLPAAAFCFSPPAQRKGEIICRRRAAALSVGGKSGKDE